MIEVITVRDVIRMVADRFKEQYYDEDRREWRRGSGGPKACATYISLCILDKETATPDDVARIVGNPRCTDLRCDACGAAGLSTVVMVGEAPNSESHTVILCASCVEKAGEALRVAP